MRRNFALLTGILIVILLSTRVSSIPSFYIPDTLVEDKLYSEYTAIIQEGYYFLVFDNTGFITGNFNRNHSYVIYFLEFEAANIDTISGQHNVTENDYEIVTFNFDVPETYITHIYFKMYASQRISSFIVDYHGLAQYFELIGNINEEHQRTILIVVSSVSGGIIIFLALNILLIRYRVYFRINRKIKVYRNKRAGKRFKNIG